MDIVISCVTKKYASFSGRAPRSEFWLFTLFYIILLIIAGAIDFASNFFFYGYGVIGSIFWLVTLIPFLAVSIRRLHDTNRRGWWLFISIIPLIGLIWLIVLMCLRSTSGENQFGQEPLNLLGGKMAAIIGVCGVVGFILLFGLFIYFGLFQRGGVYDNLRVKLGISTITSLVSEIELYKIQNGKYPETLEAFHKSLPENSIVFVFDPTHVAMDGQQRYFYYELVDDSHYYLLGVGADEKPYTNDDVLPNIDIKKNSKIGLLIHDGSKR